MCIAALALAIVVAGCGGGDSSDSTVAAGSPTDSTTQANRSTDDNGAKDGGGKADDSGGSSLTKAEFTEQANAICTESKERGLQAMGEYVKDHESSGEAKNDVIVAAIQTVFLPEVQNQIDELRALGAPQGEEGQIEDFLAALQEGIDTAGGDSNPSSTVFAQSFKRSAELGHEYGIDACAYG